MIGNRIVIGSVVVYLILVVYMYISYSNTKFTGSDAAGNGMAKGLTFFYGLGLLFIIAVVITIINGFFFNQLTNGWLKALVAVPILTPLAIFAFVALEIGRPRPVSIEKQAHRLSIEIRSKTNIDGARSSFRTSGGGSGSKLTIQGKEDDYFMYTSSKAIFHETGRKLSIKSDSFSTPEYLFDIPFVPQIAPFTNWEPILAESNESADTFQLEIRYKVTKK
ncbi:hypothetical protein R9C00_10250 [Flammeovirgaceae bacterium SG7u.111]|nr:hypothetical protein [Flammeovirgaceae bacterium SG7u.132]WPO37833.1 hypothetical protein R9C00_10250 [Flammeovirgaceae bacterium SG7u.111]